MKTRSFAASLLVVSVLACGGPSVHDDRAAPEEPMGLHNGSFTADLDGFEIHYEVHGTGPVLMTLPNSWGLSLEGLRSLYRPLENDLTMVYFDPRGMGGSAPVEADDDMGMETVRRDFDALRRHLGLERVNAIGWSNGAMNLILLASERPETLESAIFVHGAASFTEDDMGVIVQEYPELMQGWAAMEQALAEGDMPVDEKTARMKAFWLGEYFPLAMANPEIAAPAVEQVFADAEFSWPHARYADHESPTFDARDKLAGIGVRSLVIAGAHDMIPVASARALAEGLPDGRFVLFADSGHFAPIEQPVAFQQAILEFLKVIEPPPSLGAILDEEPVETGDVGGPAE